MTLEPPYTYWPIVDRPQLTLPEGKRMACYVGLNVEHFEMGKPATSRTAVTAGLPVDPLNYGWRDYGVRVGFWRILRLLDDLHWPASVLLNADVIGRYPEVIEAGVRRDWAFLGHGRTNSAYWSGMDIDTERRELRRLSEEIAQATGRPPQGWLGPAFTETENTLALLAETGFSYSLDWNADDEPFPMDVPNQRFISVPYSIEVNDITTFIGQGMDPSQFTRIIVDQFEVMYEDAARRPGSVFSVALHPFITGQPFRYKHLAEALNEIAGKSDVWYTTTDAIAKWYLDQHYDAMSVAIADLRKERER